VWSCGTGTGWRLSGSSGDRSGARVSTRAPETAAVDPARVHGPRPGAVPPDRSVPASRPQEPTTAPSGTLPVQGNLPSPPADRPMAQPAETCGERPHGTTAQPSDGPPARGDCQVLWRATHERRHRRVVRQDGRRLRPTRCSGDRPLRGHRRGCRRTDREAAHRGHRRTARTRRPPKLLAVHPRETTAVLSGRTAPGPDPPGAPATGPCEAPPGLPTNRPRGRSPTP
jgi:hypothetical protein